MFDEYVEHVAGPTVLPAHIGSPPTLYEGFEPPTGLDELAEDVVELSDTPAGNVTPDAPIFDLGRVQFAFPAPLASFVISSDMLCMGLTNNMLVLIELTHEDQVLKIQIPRKPTEMTLYKVFMDPSGRHIIITSQQGENWYLYKTWKKPRQLKGFKMVIESVAWNKTALLSSSHLTSTREILIGARNGIIYEAVLDAEDDFFKSQERYLQSVFALPERHPITGLKFDYTPATDPQRALVLVTTSTRIYQFTGPIDRKRDENGRIFSALFSQYRDTAPKILELPGNLAYSELRFFTPNSSQALSQPQRLAWLTGQGIYHGTINYDASVEDHIDSAQLLQYPTLPGIDQPDIPISLAVTEFHFVLLYKDRVVGICNLDDRKAYEELLPIKPSEEVRGLAADPVRKTYWVFTDQSLFELVVTNEDRDVWRTYLEKGLYSTALQYAKTASQRDQILKAQGDHHFKEGRYFQAAQAFAHSSASFEEVVLKLLEVGDRDSLRSYLVSRLERTRKTDITQRMMLATWLVEFYLGKCNELDDIIASESVSQDVENLRVARTELEDELRQFFETYRANLNKEAVYELIQGHGRTDMYLHYATVIGDFRRVVEHYILEEEWLKAIEVISRQTDLELYYRFGSVLIRQAPKETVDSWIRQTSLDPHRLIPCLLQLQHAPRDPLSPNQAIRYLNHVVFEQGDISPTIHNLLLTFHVSPSSPPKVSTSSDDDGPLLRFLSTAPTDLITGKPYYDLDYALRLCKMAGRTQPCVHLYSKLGLWENSVDLALEKGDLDLAKINADMPEDDQPLRKKLWLKIARYVVQDKKDIKAAMRFLENTDLLKIEDILPFFPDFVVIDDFKEEIAHALEGYSAHIDDLKAEMDDATKTAEAIQKDIAALKNRFITIDAGEQCSNCSNLLLTRQFYVFPCHHTFHADCLIGMAKEYLPAHALRRILLLQNQLVKENPPPRKQLASADIGRPQPAPQRTLLSTNFGPIANPLQNGAKAANLIGRGVISAGDRLRDLIVPDALATLVSAPTMWIPGMGGGGVAKPAASDKLGSAKAEKLRAELDDLLTSNCPLCESVIVGLDKPFVKEGEAESSWTL
ncbi:DigA protein [Ephemerocybe angulata]|uniref:DigA protein n=1 Tax=Ephemerocybe angulata TaxID=980116 RepID=A0A8H6IJ62_9AGAR|nr:DigA protein [Tulosesus angulatus]